jgi:hypothetical protein
MPFVPKTKASSSSSSGSGILGWTPSTAYAIGSAVYIGDTIYICLVAHTSSATFLSDQSKWKAMASTFTHEQTEAAALWTVDHNLGRKPSVSVRNLSDVEVFATVEHANDNRLFVIFGRSATGRVYCT